MENISIPQLRFVPLADSDIPMLEQWHEDLELSRRYGGRDWPRKFLKMTQQDPHRKGWVAWSDGLRVAYIDLEIVPQECIGHIGLVVHPALCGKGYGKKALADALQLPAICVLKEIRAGIEQDNTVSIRCFMALGFRQLNEVPDHEGCLNFSYEMR